MFEYQFYSKDIWEYLCDMPYMPSRTDRERLLRDPDGRRVKIWDYFFRIRHEDVGRPQQNEILSIRKKLEKDIKSYEETRQSKQKTIRELKRTIRFTTLKRVACSLASTLSGLGILYYLHSSNHFLALMFSIPAFLYGLIMIGGIVFVTRDDRRRIILLKKQIENLRAENNKRIVRARKRILSLEVEIKELILQIPSVPEDEEVRNWFVDDFDTLKLDSKEKTGLSAPDSLPPIRGEDEQGIPFKSDNPISVIGPGELQESARIPKSFKEIPDFKKHLSARKAFYWQKQGAYEVLYGVYYVEFILIGKNMLATCGLFYDFITGEKYGEQITEQYYTDVVAISKTNESRTINLGLDTLETIYIENAPTFILSLASGDHRTVTFVNENYFKLIKEKIEIGEDNIHRIYWIKNAEQVAENATRALRRYLRTHKTKNGNNNP